MHTPLNNFQTHERARQIEDAMSAYQLARKVVAMEEQLEAAKAALYESAKQHRCRGDHGHANLCEVGASRIQLEEPGPCKRCSGLKRLPNYRKKATTPCPDCNPAANGGAA